MKKIICDRCGGGISGRPVHISVYGDKDVARKYGENIRKIDFCAECIEDIVDFALNKDTCDECVRAMEAESAMLRASDEEAEVSPNMEKYKTVMDTYLGEPVRREGCAVDGNEESGRQKEPDSDIEKYQNAIEQYGIPMKCAIMPVLSSNNRSEDA